MPVTEDVIRHTIRVSRKTHPHIYASVVDYHVSDEPWTATFIRILEEWDELRHGNTQIRRLERKFDESLSKLADDLRGLTHETIAESELILERKSLACVIPTPQPELPEVDLTDDPLGNMEGWD